MPWPAHDLVAVIRQAVEIQDVPHPSLRSTGVVSDTRLTLAASLEGQHAPTPTVEIVELGGHMAKQRPTFEEHVEFGRILYDIRHELQRVYVELAKRYPKNQRVVRALDRSLRALEEARSNLDNASANEHPQLWCAHVYYPGQSDPHDLPHQCTTSTG
jgi:hypothetical protein